MFDNIKKKMVNELLLISKAEEFVTALAQFPRYCLYIEDDGWHFVDDAPQFHTKITHIPYDVRDAAIDLNGSYIETRADVDIEFYSDENIEFKDGHYRFSNSNVDDVIIDSWDRDYTMLGEINFFVYLSMVDRYGVGDRDEDARTQFKILIALDNDYKINTIITTEYNDTDTKDFFNEVIDLEDSDEDYNRVIIDPNLPRTELVEWFSSILRMVDKIFGTKYERLDNVYSFTDISCKELCQRSDDDNE